MLIHVARMMTEQNGNIATSTELNESVRPAADVPPNRDSLVNGFKLQHYI